MSTISSLLPSCATQAAMYFFHTTGCGVTLDSKTILRGWCDPKNCLWQVMIVANGWTTKLTVRNVTQPIVPFATTPTGQRANSILIKTYGIWQPWPTASTNVPTQANWQSQLPHQASAHQGYQQSLHQAMVGVNIPAYTLPHLYLNRVRDGIHGSKLPRCPIHPTYSSKSKNWASLCARHCWWPHGWCPSGMLNLWTSVVFDVKVIYHLWVTLDSSVVFSHHAFIAFGGDLMVAGLSSFAVLFPSIGFLLVVGHLVSNCDLRCIVALMGIAAYLAIHPIT